MVNKADTKDKHNAPLPLFAIRIKELRERAGLTQRQLADRLGKQEHAVIRWESGKVTPNSEALEDLAREFGVSMDYIYGRTDKGSGQYEPGKYTDLEVRVVNALRRGDLFEILFVMSTDENLKVKLHKWLTDNGMGEPTHDLEAKR